MFRKEKGKDFDNNGDLINKFTSLMDQKDPKCKCLNPPFLYSCLFENLLKKTHNEL